MFFNKSLCIAVYCVVLHCIVPRLLSRPFLPTLLFFFPFYWKIPRLPNPIRTLQFWRSRIRLVTGCTVLLARSDEWMKQYRFAAIVFCCSACYQSTSGKTNKMRSVFPLCVSCNTGCAVFLCTFGMGFVVHLLLQLSIFISSIRSHYFVRNTMWSIELRDQLESSPRKWYW